MRSIRMAVVGATIAMGIATGAFAQGQGGGGRGGMMMQRMLDGITLTDAQQTQIKAIQAKYEPQMQELRQKMRQARQSGGGMDSAAMAQMHDTNTKERDEIRAVLTPDQQAKFDENAKNMMQRRRGGPPSE